MLASRPEPIRRRTGRQAIAGRQLLLVAACGLAVIALAIGVLREAANPRFAVDLVAVEGLGHTSYEDVVTAAALPPGQNAWLINRRVVASRIAGLPWVEQVSLHLGWPNRLTIVVSERRPVALVAIAGTSIGAPPRLHYAVIDDSQRVLALAPASQAYQDLPLVIVQPLPGEAPPGSSLGRTEVGQALDAYRRLSSLGLRVSEVAIAPSTGISATADRNIRVIFGEDEDLSKKAQLFQAIVEKISTPSRVAYVDVRSIRAPTVLYR